MSDDPASLSSVVRSGDRAESLERLRDHLAARLESAADERVIAPMAKQLADVMRELDQVRPRKEAGPIDDLAAARAARRADAEASKRTPVGDQRRSGSRRSGQSGRTSS